MSPCAMLLTLLGLSFSCISLIAIQQDEIEANSDSVTQSWRHAAASWGMDLKTYRAEADKLLDEYDNSASYAKIGYDDLVPFVNPYTNLAPAVKAELIKSLGTQAAYDNFIREQEKICPKFTIPR